MHSTVLRTVVQLSREYPNFSEAALRSLIQKSEINGLSVAIVRVGGRVFLDEPKFKTWLFGR